jgi:16S rRNA pseudouridine516 synthase
LAKRAARALPVTLRPAELLFSQGFGSRRECLARVMAGELSLQGRALLEPDEPIAVHDGLRYEVRGEPWVFHRQALLMLHKPAGHECSRAPQHHPSVFGLLPAPLRVRGVQPVGRLDADTTGLLLFTDDGSLLHRLSSPRHHVAKVYEAVLKHPLDDGQRADLERGVLLHGEPKPLRALQTQALGSHAIRLTLDEGKYHQVKRMLAAVGNRVEALHRSAIGSLQLPADLLPGQWRWIDRRLLDAPTPAAGLESN